MNPPDVTSETSKWIKIREGNHPLWQNTDFLDIYSTDGGKTFTIGSEREAPDKERQVRVSRVV